MFLLVSVRNVAAHPGCHQHGVYIFGYGYLVYGNILDLNLGEDLCIFTFFHFPDSGLGLLNGFDFYFDLL